MARIRRIVCSRIRSYSALGVRAGFTSKRDWEIRGDTATGRGGITNEQKENPRISVRRSAC